MRTRCPPAPNRPRDKDIPHLAVAGLQPGCGGACAARFLQRSRDDYHRPVWLWSEGEGGWHFLTTPREAAVEIRWESAASGVRRGFGSMRVEAAIDGVAWRTFIFPRKSGGYLLPIKAEVRRREYRSEQ